MSNATLADYRQFYETHLEEFHEYAPGKAKALCPFHFEEDGSFDIRLDTGQWFCHGACKRGGNAVTLAQEKGIPLTHVPGDRPGTITGTVTKRTTPPLRHSDLPTAKKRVDPWVDSKIVAEYPYTDAKGTYLFHEVRFEPKTFRLAIKNGSGWVRTLESLGERKRTLYKLPDFLDHTSDTAWIAEGCKDADRLIALGLRATTIPMGGGSWHPAYNKWFKDQNVIAVLDNDETGEKFGREIVANLSTVAKSVKLLRLPGIPVKGDVSDWLDQGHTAAELLDLAGKVDGSEKEKGKMDCIETGRQMMSKQFVPIKWILKGVWPYKGRGWVVGNPGSGKTWLTMEMAFSITTGEPFLGDYEVLDPGKVLYIQQELPEEYHQERWNLMLPPKNLPSDVYDKFLDNFYHLTNRQLILPEDTEILINRIKDENFKAIFFDSFSESHFANENSAHEMRQILLALTRVRNETGAGVIVIHHLHKSNKDASHRPIWERIRGSSMLWGWRNAIIAMTSDPNDDFKSKVEFNFQTAEKTQEFVFSRDKVETGFLFNKIDITQTDKFQDTKDRILEVLEKENKPMSFNKLSKKAGGNRNLNRQATQDLETNNLISRNEKGYSLTQTLI